MFLRFSTRRRFLQKSTYNRRLPRWTAAIILIVAIFPALAPAGDAKSPEIPLFVLDNGVGRSQWTPEQQAQTVKELGYDGMAYNYTDDPQAVALWQKELQKRGLKLFALYLQTYPDRAGAERFPPKLRETIRELKGSGTILWISLLKDKKKQQTASDEARVNIVLEISDWARESGLKVALYPHFGYYVATAEDALRITRQVNRPDVGLTLNLCHELMAKNDDRLPEIVRQAAPRLFLVTVNGADRNAKKEKYIQRLDQGNFDVYGFLKTVRANGYRGPIGLQCYAVPGDVRENLQKSIAAWKNYARRLAAEAKP